MIFTVALYLSKCRRLESCRAVKRRLCADNLKCVSSCEHALFEAGSPTGISRWMGRPWSPESVCCSALPQWLGGSCGTGSYQARGINGRLDCVSAIWEDIWTPLVGVGPQLLLAESWACLLLFWSLPLRLSSKLRILRTKFLPGALHTIEGSRISFWLLQRLRTAFVAAVGSRKMPLAHVGAVLLLLDGPPGCDPGFYVVWCRFRLLRGYLAFYPLEAPRLCNLLGLAAGAGVSWSRPRPSSGRECWRPWLCLGPLGLGVGQAWLASAASSCSTQSTFFTCDMGGPEI